MREKEERIERDRELKGVDNNFFKGQGMRERYRCYSVKHVPTEGREVEGGLGGTRNTPRRIRLQATNYARRRVTHCTGLSMVL